VALLKHSFVTKWNNEPARWSEAESSLHEGLAIRERVIPDDWRRFTAMNLLGGALLGQGRHAETEPLIVQGYEGMKARRQDPRMEQVQPARGGGTGGAAV
jgi:hypothetical protein